MTREATFDDTGRYRYRLVRAWAEGKPTVTFVMLNPSTADATVDDATILRCRGYAERWGFGRLVVVNLFAYRSTRPEQLQRVADPVGPENDRYIVEEVVDADRVIAAWGSWGWLHGRHGIVLDLIRGYQEPLCLGLTKDGRPVHPLRQPYDATLVPVPR